MKVNVTYYVDKTTVIRLQELAKKKDRSASWMLNYIVNQTYRRMKRTQEKENS